METFFKTLSNLTDNISIGELRNLYLSKTQIKGDISRLFSNTWLDLLFKPEWER